MEPGLMRLQKLYLLTVGFDAVIEAGLCLMRPALKSVWSHYLMMFWLTLLLGGFTHEAWWCLSRRRYGGCLVDAGMEPLPKRPRCSVWQSLKWQGYRLVSANPWACDHFCNTKFITLLLFLKNKIKNLTWQWHRWIFCNSLESEIKTFLLAQLSRQQTLARKVASCQWWSISNW